MLQSIVNIVVCKPETITQVTSLYVFMEQNTWNYFQLQLAESLHPVPSGRGTTMHENMVSLKN